MADAFHPDGGYRHMHLYLEHIQQTEQMDVAFMLQIQMHAPIARPFALSTCRVANTRFSDASQAANDASSCISRKTSSAHAGQIMQASCEGRDSMNTTMRNGVRDCGNQPTWALDSCAQRAENAPIQRHSDGP